MVDHRALSSTRAIEAYRTGKTNENLLKFATWLTQSEADAEDLLSDAMICVCDPDEGRPWDPARGSFGTHMRMVLADLAKRERRSARKRREVLDSTFAFDESLPNPGPAPDEALSDARGLERLRHLGGKLRERISHKPRAVQVFDHAYQGVEDADELARLIGCTVSEIYDANRQIAYHAAKVLAEEEQAEAERMKSLRERAKKNKEPT
jgi:DNA-directed RNA polymerase specialized sigma24 family protein